MWWPWHDSVPTTGLTSVDHRQPGRKTARPIVAPVSSTRLMSPWSKEGCWSGVSRFLASQIMGVPPVRLVATLCNGALSGASGQLRSPPARPTCVVRPMRRSLVWTWSRQVGEVAMAVTAQLEFTEDELLANADVKEPLIAGGVRCHGGFADDGTDLSPRTKFRVPAIEAWGAHH